MDLCDSLFSQYIVRSRGKCEIGGDWCDKETLQTSHNYSRSHKSIRFEEINVLCLCDHHHRQYERMTAMERQALLESKLGFDRHQELLEMKNQVKHWYDHDLKILSQKLKMKLKEL